MNSKYMCTFIVLATTSLMSEVSLQVINKGPCPQRSVKSDFDIVKYLGTWYQYANFGTEFFQGRGKCVTAQYSYDKVLKKVNVHNSQINLLTGSPNSIDGNAILENPDKREGKLLVTFTFKVLARNISVTSPYWVLDTDYNSWAVVISCTDVSAFHFTAGWILTRKQDLSGIPTREDVTAQINNALVTAKLKPSFFTKTNQVDCNKNWRN